MHRKPQKTASRHLSLVRARGGTARPEFELYDSRSNGAGGNAGTGAGAQKKVHYGHSARPPRRGQEPTTGRGPSLRRVVLGTRPRATPGAPVRMGRKLTRRPNTSSPGRRQGQSCTTLVWATTARARPQGHGRERRVNSDLVELKGPSGGKAPTHHVSRTRALHRRKRTTGREGKPLVRTRREAADSLEETHAQPTAAWKCPRAPITRRSKQKPPGARTHDTQETRAGERADTGTGRRRGQGGGSRGSTARRSAPQNHPTARASHFRALPKQRLPPGPRGAAKASPSHGSAIRLG